MVLTESRIKLKTGDQALAFSLAGVDGKTYSLADFSSYQGMLIIFMCNHCPYVQAKIEAINELQEKFGDQIAIVGINSNDPDYPGEGMNNMKKFAAERGIKFSYLFDENQKVARNYGATCTPDPFLFGREGKLVFHGRINDAMEPGDPITEKTMADNIEKLLTGRKIENDFQPSIGCSIKWLK